MALKLNKLSDIKILDWKCIFQSEIWDTFEVISCKGEAINSYYIQLIQPKGVISILMTGLKFQDYVK